MGRCTSVAFGQLAVIRSTAAWPRCDEPLSTIQNTRRAEAYGSVVMTCSTRPAKGLMPFFGSQQPITFPLSTSRAAR